MVVAAKRKEKVVGSSKTANLDANFQNNMTHNAVVTGYPTPYIINAAQVYRENQQLAMQRRAATSGEGRKREYHICIDRSAPSPIGLRF